MPIIDQYFQFPMLCSCVDVAQISHFKHYSQIVICMFTLHVFHQTASCMRSNYKIHCDGCVP